jgi:hypothetical protein
MKSRIYKIFLVLSVSAVIFLFPTDNTNGCADFSYYDVYYEILNPKVLKTSLEPFFFSESDYYNEKDLDEKKANLLDWKNYFQNVPKYKDLNAIIYNSKIKDLLEVKKYVIYDSLKFINNYSGNSVVKYWMARKDTESVAYLIFAKKCEPDVEKPQGYWGEIKRDTVYMNNLIKLGIKEYKNTKSDFVKLRYGYQIVRLAQYTGQYKRAVDLYDSLISKLKVKSIIQDWALSNKAGCLLRLGDRALSLRLFAKVFSECPSRRKAAIESFDFKNDSLFNECLQLCENNKEKIAAWFMRAYDGSTIRGIEEINQLDESSNYMSVLLTRAVNMYEKDIQQKNALFKDSLSAEQKQQGEKILKLSSRIEKESKIKNRNLWYAVSGYMSGLLAHESNAKVYFSKAALLTKANDIRFTTDLKYMRIVSKILNLRKLDSTTESSILGDLKWFKENQVKPYWNDTTNIDNVYSFIKKVLAYKYLMQGDSVKMGIFDDIYLYAYSNSISRKIYSFMNRKDLTEYDKFILETFRYKKSNMRNIIGTNYIFNHEYSKAIRIFKEGKTKLDTLKKDPFSVNLNDYPVEKIKNGSYTKLTYAERMVELDSLLKTGDPDSAQDYYLLANGYYNITFFGNSWNAATFYWTIDTTFYNNIGSINFYSSSAAEKYYVKAMNTAKSREFAAKCCFMASKCEQNDYYNKSGRLTSDIWLSVDSTIKHSDYRTFFRILKNKYSDTQFYKEALHECKYFNTFVKR